MDKLSINWALLGPLLVTSAVTIVGWIAGHAFNTHRDRINKKREIRIANLIRIYQELMKFASTVEIQTDDELIISWAGIISDVQLFGTPKLAALAATASDELQAEARASTHF